ncbi:MarR family winged helix-turn-helix transcriptional regulator [Levilactobacillus yonginensis]|uniref:MarR family winged helix-turn-helix transcriptional regulator n=1 Tax=Levilactobacillus yonginensis TaxID=1054041 RepID=UPI00345D6CFE
MQIIQLGKFIGILHRRLQTAISHDLTLPELNASNANFLLFISEHERVTAKQISNELAINKGLVSREMLRLETAGYIERHSDQTDRRTIWITITQSGMDASRSIRRLLKHLWQEVLGETASTDLETVYENLLTWSERITDLESPLPGKSKS